MQSLFGIEIFVSGAPVNNVRSYFIVNSGRQKVILHSDRNNIEGSTLYTDTSYAWCVHGTLWHAMFMPYKACVLYRQLRLLFTKKEHYKSWLCLLAYRYCLSLPNRVKHLCNYLLLIRMWSFLRYNFNYY